MKLSLASILLHAVENAKGPVTTTWLVRIAEGEGYKNARAATWVQLGLLQKNGYIRTISKGAGGKANKWVPTISTIPQADGRIPVEGRNGRG